MNRLYIPHAINQFNQSLPGWHKYQKTAFGISTGYSELFINVCWKATIWPNICALFKARLLLLKNCSYFKHDLDKFQFVMKAKKKKRAK